MAADTIYKVRVSSGRYEVVEYTVYDSGHQSRGEVVAEYATEPDAQAECDKRNTEQLRETSDYSSGR